MARYGSLSWTKRRSPPQITLVVLTDHDGFDRDLLQLGRRSSSIPTLGFMVLWSSISSDIYGETRANSLRWLAY